MSDLSYKLYRSIFNQAGHGNLTRAPIHVDIELAKRCNLACTMCPYGSDEWVSTQTQGMMKTELALQLVREIKDLGVLALKPNFRGEPLMHKDLERVLHEAQGMADIRINTNLTALTMARAYALKNLCDLIIVSQDGATKETYESIRVGASWERHMANLQMLADVKGKAKVSVQFVEQISNAHESEMFIKQCEDMGFEALVKPVMSRHENGDFLMGDRKATGRQLCQQPYQRIVVGFDGRAYACCSAWYEESYIGTYPDQSISDLLNSYAMNRIRQLARSPDAAEPCKSCQVGTSYTWG